MAHEVENDDYKSRSLWRIAWRRLFKHRLAIAGITVLGFLVLLVTLGPLFIREEASLETNLDTINQPPSWRHPFGTDEVGRDIGARLLYGGRISLMVGAFSMSISVVIGTVLGLVSGYYGGRVDTIIMRFTDIMLSIPPIFLLIVLAVFFGPSLRTIILVIGLLSWMNLARVVRGEVLAVREAEYCQAAVAQGSPHFRIIFRHVLPNIMAPIIVGATLGVGTALLTESALSYLGLGVQPPIASWGNMLRNAQVQIWTAPWAALFPGLAILVTVLSINFVGDGLRDALDPRLHRS